MKTWQDYRKQIDEVSRLDFNFSEVEYSEELKSKGWNFDRYESVVGAEPQGPPQVMFETCVEMAQSYSFPDPNLIQGYFDPSSPMAGRNMLLRAQFLGFVFYFGTRVTGEYRKTELIDGQEVYVWGFSYRTLKGHFEAGEIFFEILKYTATGNVTFRIRAYSKPDEIPTWYYRIGFKLFGRSLQKYFAYSSMRRLKALVQKKMAIHSGSQIQPDQIQSAKLQPGQLHTSDATRNSMVE